ncbi:rCG21661 [Rattus norvegicus]|uniref:RCG21661 n=1 Tax=Rattus norvegicus TaxID=10116 RepID=A6J0T8_RAT|nr:rCG21661 [Rattus norvegicus]
MPLKNPRRPWSLSLFQNHRIGADSANCPWVQRDKDRCSLCPQSWKLGGGAPLSVCLCVHVYVHVYEGQRATLTVIYKVPFTFCGAGTLPNKWINWPVSLRHVPVSTFSVLRLQA